MKWRPEGFTNPYHSDQCSDKLNSQASCFEAGADAMLDALKSGHPCYVNKDNVATINFPLGYAKGYVVFIPEDSK